MDKYLFGIDVGGTTVKVGFFKEDGILLDKWEIPTRKENNGEYILSDVAQSIENKIESQGISKGQIIGYGCGIPGPVTDDGRVLGCVNLGWGEFNIEERMAEVFECSNVKAANDANVAALGENWVGGGKGLSSMVMITLGTGVGGGVIINNKIVAGFNGAAGEIGHAQVKDDETDYCNCGKAGCLEQYASATGVVKEAKRILSSSTEDSKLRSIETLTAKDVFDAAKEGDKLANEVVAILGKYLGKIMAHVSCVVDPEAFLIGGGVSKAGSILIDAVEDVYKKEAFRASRDAKILLASLGNDAGMYGVAALVCDKKNN